MYYVGPDREDNSRLGKAVILACALHLALFFSLGFELPETASYQRQIEVTLAHRPSEKAPEEARLLAQANQRGTDDQREIADLNSPPPSPPEPSPAGEQPAPLSTTADARLVTRTEPDEGDPQISRIDRELLRLQEELDQQALAYAQRPRVRRLTSASTKQAADAAYLHDWRKRLEAVGTLYYPEASLRYGIYGSLRLLVVIRHDGSLEEVRVLSSSGYAVLDEAAVKLVRMAAPYAPFPPELRATTDKLEIIRTWQFQENGLSSD